MFELFAFVFIGLYLCYAVIVSDVFRELLGAVKVGKTLKFLKRWLLGEVGGGDAGWD